MGSIEFKKPGNSFEFPKSTDYILEQTASPKEITVATNITEKSLRIVGSGNVERNYADYTGSSNDYARYKINLLTLFKRLGKNKIYLQLDTYSAVTRDEETRYGRSVNTANCYITDGTTTTTLISSQTSCSFGYKGTKYLQAASKNGAIYRFERTGESIIITLINSTASNITGKYGTATGSIQSTTTVLYDLENAYMYFNVVVTTSSSGYEDNNRSTVYSEILARFLEFVDDFNNEE